MKRGNLRLLPLGLLALGLAACGGPEAAAPPAASAAAPVAVTVATARLENLAGKIEASAALEAARRVAPGSKILGRVFAVPVRAGDAVKAGQVLARLESRDLEAAVAQARAALAMAEAQARSAAAMARRMRDLAGRGSATAKNLEDAVAGEEIANAGVLAAQANLEAAQVMLSYAVVSSPLAGYVVERRIEAGDMAAPGQPLFVIEDLTQLEAVAAIPESEVAGLAPGMPAEVRVDALGRTYPSQLLRLVPAGNQQSRSFEARFKVDNPDLALKSGLYARVALAGGPAREILRVKATALRQRGQLSSVFVVDGNLARLRFVKTGRVDDQGIEILSGLGPGDRYLLAPPATLADGAPISITEGN